MFNVCVLLHRCMLEVSETCFLVIRIMVYDVKLVSQTAL